ncbi:MAG: hypothetical protein CM1200mP34_0610 [Verrucomicrobiales bacterium]|nr:MAG: hypothetical protein CM1200mP34_0610 [Verrucomicrobiales bacterium]
MRRGHPRLERLAKAKPDSARVPLTLANFLRKYDRLEEAVCTVARWLGQGAGVG